MPESQKLKCSTSIPNTDAGMPESQKLKCSTSIPNTDAGMPEWSNGTDSRSVGLVPTKVQILLPAYR